MSEENSYKIRVLERAMRVIDLLSEGVPMTLTEINKELDISNTTIFRILKTLEAYNFVTFNQQSKQYRLGIKCLELSSAYYGGDNLRALALSDLESLRDETGESVHLGILDKMEVIYIEKLQGLHAIGLMSSAVGRRSPAYCTGLGKALIAHEDHEKIRQYYETHKLKQFTTKTIKNVDELIEELSIVRDRGYAFDLGEHETDVYCVSTTIKDYQGEVVAALSISGPKSRLQSIESDTSLIDSLRRTAITISDKLRTQRFIGKFY